MRLAVKSPVWDDLREIGLRIAKDNPEAFELVARHPAIGRLQSYSLAGVRSWVVPGFENYVIFYLPTPDEVRILAVLHGARDLPGAMKGRVD